MRLKNNKTKYRLQHNKGNKAASSYQTSGHKKWHLIMWKEFFCILEHTITAFLSIIKYPSILKLGVMSSLTKATKLENVPK